MAGYADPTIQHWHGRSMTHDEAGDWITAWSFDTLRLHRVELCHSTANKASCRVAQYAGFTLEGTKRAEARHIDGWPDMHLHSRLDSDR